MARGVPVRHPGGVYVQPGSPPVVRSIEPATTKINVAASVLITGGGFSAASVVKLDGTALAAPTFIDDTHLRISIPSFPAPGTKALTVETGGKASNAVNFAVTVTTAQDDAQDAPEEIPDNGETNLG